MVRKVGEVEVIDVSDDNVEVLINGKAQRFDLIVNACGHRPSCLDLPLLKELHKVEPVETVGGLPVLTPDLQWGNFKQLFVIGALASLQVGPDAGNLMGLGRAAQMVTDAMNLGKAFSKYKNSEQSVQGWYKSNRFAEAFDSSDSDSSDSEDDGKVGSETDASMEE